MASKYPASIQGREVQPEIDQLSKLNIECDSLPEVMRYCPLSQLVGGNSGPEFWKIGGNK